ncbi:MAG: lamin tail domain-containing protein, partial [Verrucomicrobiales bacterium]|nr:lamin tail domain-containing protein [Verrucomicrobiales bacterium]
GGFLAAVMGMGGMARAEVRISEIFYQPGNTNLLEEWFELSNTAGFPVDLTGWRMTRGVRKAFTVGTSIPAGGFLVVAAHDATFAAHHPTVQPVVSGWEGILSDDGETLELVDAANRVVDSVHYAPDGDWAVRRLGPPDFANRRGWEWYALHAGGGRSLERRRQDWDGNAGHNWDASLVDGGTPGAANSIAAEPVPPMITQVTQFLVVPRSDDPARMSCRVVALGTTPAVVTLRWRVEGSGSFTEVPMLDDGAHGDGLPGDGRYGAMVPALSDGTLVEWNIVATDATGISRIYPRVDSDVPARTGNPVYQVDNTEIGGAQPVLRLILPEAERDYLATEIWGKRPDSDAAVNGTWVSRDGVESDSGGWHARILCGIRNRGHGTRTFSPHNIHVSFANAEPWKNRTAINLNTYHVASQQLGSAVYRWLGMPVAASTSVQVRLNGVNLAKPGAEQYGSYAANEPINDRLAVAQFPDDDAGNLYRGVRDMLPGIDSDANLAWLGASHTNYVTAYAKENHVDRGDWSDLLHLIDVLNHTPDSEYLAAVRSVIDVDQWARYFAISTLLGNQENSLANGSGDDYVLYRGVLDARFKVLPYDMDSLLGRGGRTDTYADGIWRMTNVPVMHRLLTHPEVAPVYLRELRDLAAGPFSPERLNPRLDQWLGGYVDSQAIANMKAFATSQVAHVLSRFPHGLRVVHGLSETGGVLRATQGLLALSGEADAVETRLVTVQDASASWSPVHGTWEFPGVVLKPGLNRIRIAALGPNRNLVEEQWLDVQWGDAPALPVGTTLAADTTWTAADGPRRVASTLTVQGTATLRIEAGTTIQFAPGADLVIGPSARLLVYGTPEAPVRFTRAPGSTAAWGGVLIQGAAGSPESEIKHAVFEGNGDTAVHVDGGSAWLEALRFRATDQQYVSLDNASFFVTGCEFPDATAGFELVHGTGGIRTGGRGVFHHNFFGTPIGYNDVIDFTGGNRPSTSVLHFFDNVFTGATDDILDLDGTDAWVEGNLFLHVHRNGSPDSASAVSGGSNGSSTSEVTLVGNLFYDVDQAATGKQGNFYVLLNNTIVRQTKVGGLDTDAGVVNFADDGTTEGAGMVLMGNVIHDIEKLTRNHVNAKVTMSDNLLPVPWDGPGSGNSLSAPRFVRVPALEETLGFKTWEQAQILRRWLALRPGSGARQAGAGASDWGMYRGLGIQVSAARDVVAAGDPMVWHVGPSVRGAELLPAAFGGVAGFVEYRYSVDGGAWSEFLPTSQPLTVSGLAPGPHLLAVIGRRDTGLAQDDSVWGPLAFPPALRRWTVSTGAVEVVRPSVRLAEVLADGVGLGTNLLAPDWVEIENYGDTEVDLSGMGLSDSVAVPHRFAFPASTRLAAGARLVVPSTLSVGEVGMALGFGLDRSGGLVRLVESVADGGEELDVVRYGPQLPQRTLGRAPDGEWVLSEPTPGRPNLGIPTSGPEVVRLNEWMADARFSAEGDFVELLNVSEWPAELGGVGFSDAAGSPARHVFPPLSFVEAKRSLVLAADGDVAAGDDHLGFKLSADGGQLLLTSTAGVVLDSVVYGPQRTDVSEGRSPDGGTHIATFPAPTPGAANPGGHAEDCDVVTDRVPLLTLNAEWRYNQTQNLDGVGWTTREFDDAAWPVGRGLLAVEDCDCLPSPGIGTALRIGRMTYYFRAQIDVPTNLAGFNLRLTSVLDDGMVVYLNGVRRLTVGMDTDAPAYDTDASRNVGNGAVEEFTVPAGDLPPGPAVVAVEVHQANTTSSDVTFGLEIVAQRSVTNCVPAEGTSVRLNELLAVQSPGSEGVAAHDYVELMNFGALTVDLGGMGLTDDPSAPAKWTFSQGTSLPPGGFLVLRCDATLPASSTNTGFGLDAGGGVVHLHDRPERGAVLIDAVRYGIQIADATLSRFPDAEGDWTLGEPTPGGTNRAVALGAPTQLRLNEWLADASVGSDWFEIWNGGALPVALGGLGLTDAPSSPGSEAIAPRSYIGAGSRGYVQFHADGNPAAGADHVGFSLRKAGEGLAILSTAGVVLDALTFGPQATDQSEGRFPDGAEERLRFPGPTPGAPNVRSLDADGDGLPDTWEQAHFGNLSALAEDDADLDGLSNLGEYLAGTDPRDDASVFRVRAVSSPAGIVLRWTAVGSRIYEVQQRASLESGDWTTLLTLTGAGEKQVEDPVPAEAHSRFYRVVARPMP